LAHVAAQLYETSAKSKSPLISWTKQFESLRTLSLRQPWAWLVVNGYKDIENHSWRTNHRGALLIHASLNRSEFELTCRETQKRHRVKIPSEEKLDFGGIVGLVDVVDCVKTYPSEWKFRAQLGLGAQESEAATVSKVQRCCRFLQTETPSLISQIGRKGGFVSRANTTALASGTEARGLDLRPANEQTFHSQRKFAQARRPRRLRRQLQSQKPARAAIAANSIERNTMLWTIVVILLVLWLLGFIGHVGGGLIHLLLVIAVIVVIINLIQGRRGL
jgi:hypothetical protein